MPAIVSENQSLRNAENRWFWIRGHCEENARSPLLTPVWFMLLPLHSGLPLTRKLSWFFRPVSQTAVTTSSPFLFTECILSWIRVLPLPWFLSSCFSLSSALSNGCESYSLSWPPGQLWTSQSSLCPALLTSNDGAEPYGTGPIPRLATAVMMGGRLRWESISHYPPQCLALSWFVGWFPAFTSLTRTSLPPQHCLSVTPASN